MDPPTAEALLPGAAAIRSLADADAVFLAFDAYPWSKDEAFLTGLAAILGGPSSHPPRGSPADIATHARIFYYARRVGVQIDFARYQSWLLRRPDHQPPRLLPDHPSPRGPEAALASASRQEPTTPSSPLQHPQQQEQQQQQQQPPPPQWQQAAPKAHLYVERAPPSSPTPPRADAGPDYPAAFAEMLSLLQQGRPIPGIREIPATISRHPTVKPIGPRRAPAKPWQKEAPGSLADPHQSDTLDRDFPPVDDQHPQPPTSDAASS